MGALPSTVAPRDGLPELNLMEGYPIRLTDEQAVTLLGPFHAKRTLVWADVRRHSHLTFKALVASGLTTARLFVLQPDLQQWVALRRVTVEDCGQLDQWTPDPFKHFGCKIEHLLTHRRSISASILRKAGHTVTSLTEQHGLTPQLMGALQYSMQDWLDLGLTEAHVGSITAKDWAAVFGGSLRREDVLAMVRRTAPRQ